MIIYILPECLPEYAGSSRSRFRKAEKGNVPLGRVEQPEANFIKLFFQRNLRSYQHIAFSFDSGYAASRVNYAEKMFYEIGRRINVIKLFFFANEEEVK